MQSGICVDYPGFRIVITDIPCIPEYSPQYYRITFCVLLFQFFHLFKQRLHIPHQDVFRGPVDTHCTATGKGAHPPQWWGSGPQAD